MDMKHIRLVPTPRATFEPMKMKEEEYRLHKVWWETEWCRVQTDLRLGNIDEILFGRTLSDGYPLANTARCSWVAVNREERRRGRKAW
jgi:hypothetical protein